MIPQTADLAEVFVGMPSPERVAALEQQILALPQVDLDTTHAVHGGMYARTIRIPPGTVLTGALTNADNLCIVSGDITVTTDDGPRRLVGYHVLPARAGFKRAGFAHAETFWTTVIPTDETDIAAIEDSFTDESEHLQNRTLALPVTPAVQRARDDYDALLLEHGLTEERVRWAAEWRGDHVDMPERYDALTLAASSIQGNGMFALRAIVTGEVLAPARLSGRRTPAGRYVNHSPEPNALFVPSAGDLWLVAKRDIAAGDEVLIDYRQALVVNPILKGAA